MKPTLVLLCVDDEPGVLDAVVRDLAPFEDAFRVETALDAADAARLVANLPARGLTLALALCDHLMPGTTGTDFLIALNNSPTTRHTRKILLTAQAGHEDTIRALNLGGLDHYIAKPWQPDVLRKVVLDQLTSYVIERQLDPLPYLSTLDTTRLAEALRSRHLADT
ncbi:MAG: response regulator [Opitutaceae bacterium]|jgi:two-component system chemotaxis response regulator CheY|nr:response regulator [Opitutaceae bacterium]